MRVCMEATMAGPEGTFLAGKVADLPDAEALSLIKAGYAKAISPPAKIAAPIETAALDPAEEKAVEDRPVPRRPMQRLRRGRRGGDDAAAADGGA